MKSLSKKSNCPQVTLGSYLRQGRLKKGLTQNQVGRALNVSDMFVSNIERGKCGVPAKYLLHFVSIYGLDVKEVFNKVLEVKKEEVRKALSPE
ncbi:MAG: helix-turn-helix transcriptional regulator [Pseudomonadota bacterium]